MLAFYLGLSDIGLIRRRKMIIKHDGDPSHPFKHGIPVGPFVEDFPDWTEPNRVVISPERTEEAVTARYQEVIEAVKESVGLPVLVVRRRSENAIKSGPGSHAYWPTTKCSIDFGIVRSDFVEEKDQYGRVILTDPVKNNLVHVGAYNNDVSFGFDAIRVGPRDIIDTFSTIDDEPCFEIIFSNSEIAEWFSGGQDRDYAILYDSKEPAEHISGRRYHDHLIYLKVAAELGIKPVMTEAIKYSLERRKNALLLKLAQIAMPKVIKELKKKEKEHGYGYQQLPQSISGLKKELAELGVNPNEFEEEFASLFLDSLKD